MKVKQLFGRRKPAVQGLYGAIVASARQPSLYGEQGAPDTVEGRMRMIILNLALAVGRLKELGEREVAQQLVEIFFGDMEGNLRESGISDVAIPKRMRAVEAIYVKAMSEFDAGEGIDAAFSDLPGAGSLAAIKAHAERMRSRLAGLGTADILNGGGWE